MIQKKEIDPNKLETENKLPSNLEDKIFQSWTLTKVRYDFTLIEKNIFVKIVEICQKYIDKESLGKDYTFNLDRTLFGDVPTIEFPIREVSSGTNYAQVRNSLDKLMHNAFGIPDEAWDYHTVNLFEEAKSTKKRGLMSISLTSKFWKALTELKVYKALDPKVASRFKSVYAERFYELLIGNKQRVAYSVDNLKSMFCLEEKYKNNNDFIKRVVEPAAKEMKELDICPIYFTYDIITGPRRKIDKLDFNVIEKSEEREKMASRRDLEQEVDRVVLVDRVLKKLCECFPKLVIHEELELKLKRAQLTFGVNELCQTISELRNRIDVLKKEGKVKTSDTAYFIGTLDKMVAQHKEEVMWSHTDTYSKEESEAVEVEEWEDAQYKYLSSAKVRHHAKMVEMTVEEWTKKWGFEQVDASTWRKKI